MQRLFSVLCIICLVMPAVASAGQLDVSYLEQVVEEGVISNDGYSQLLMTEDCSGEEACAAIDDNMTIDPSQFFIICILAYTRATFACVDCYTTLTGCTDCYLWGTIATIFCGG